MGGSAKYRFSKKIANARLNGATDAEIAELERQREEAIAREKARKAEQQAALIKGEYEIKPHMTEDEILKVAQKRHEEAQKVWKNAPKTAVPEQFDQYSTLEKEIETVKNASKSEEIKQNEIKTVYDTYRNALENSDDIDMTIRNISRSNSRDFNMTLDNARTALKTGIITKEEFNEIGRQVNAQARGRTLALNSAKNKWYEKRGLPKPKTGLIISDWESRMIEDLENS